jgi:tetratricopeptide (TPR) repeat protein
MAHTKNLSAPSARTTNRLIIGSILVLAIGIPLIGALYFLDQYRDPGPTMAERAIQTAEEAVRTTPNSVTSRFALAELYAAQGRQADAITQYDEILKAAPGTAGVLIGRGHAYVALDQLDKAAADFQAVIDAKKDAEMAGVDKQLQTAYYDLGSLELQRGDTAKAVGLLTHAVAINGTDADALYMLGKALTVSGDSKTAIDALRLAISLVPTGWCEPYSALAAAYAAAKDTAGAGYANGMVLSCQGQPDEARTALTAATTGTYALDAWIGLGLLAEGQGDFTAATEAYGKALAIDAKNFAAITGMGRVSAPEPGASSAVDSPAPGASGGE